MRSKKILNSEIESRRVASLPTRPTAPSAFGGAGMTSTQLKEAFDSLSLLIIERFNLLIGDVTQLGEDSLSGAVPTGRVCSALIPVVTQLGEDSLSGAVPTGISAEHTLADLFADIKNGTFASYLSVGDRSLESTLLSFEERIKKLEEMSE
jgi:hypothetical protein